MSFNDEAKKEPEVHTGIPFADKPLNSLDLNHDGVSDVKQVEHLARVIAPLVAEFVAAGGLTALEAAVKPHCSAGAVLALEKIIAAVAAAGK